MHHDRTSEPVTMSERQRANITITKAGTAVLCFSEWVAA